MPVSTSTADEAAACELVLCDRFLEAVAVAATPHLKAQAVRHFVLGPVDVHPLAVAVALAAAAFLPVVHLAAQTRPVVAGLLAGPALDPP